jgi:hypothetical protein
MKITRLDIERIKVLKREFDAVTLPQDARESWRNPNLCQQKTGGKRRAFGVAESS